MACKSFKFDEMGDFFYYRLSNEEEKDFLIREPRTYNKNKSCYGYELDLDEAMDLIIAAENLAFIKARPIHIQNQSGYTVDIIFSP